MMAKQLIKIVSVITVAAFASVQLSGCAAGGFGLTRKLGGWNNHFSMVPKVIIYLGLFIFQIYTLTLLFDFLLNNTVEFWGGSPLVSKNEYFEKDGHKIYVQHSRDPLRKTVITVTDNAGRIESVNELRETQKGTVEVFVNSEKKAELNSIGEAMVQINSANNDQQSYLHVQADTKLSENIALRSASEKIFLR